MELTSKQKREMEVLEICLTASNPLSSVGIAEKLNLLSSSIFHGRKLQHIIGDLVYSKKLKRSNKPVMVNGKSLPAYELTEAGKEFIEAVRNSIHAVSRSQVKTLPTSASALASFNIRKGNATPVTVSDTKSEIKKPTLSEAKIISPNRVSDPIARVVPMPEITVKTPPYPAVGKPGLSSGEIEVKLRELVDKMKEDGGKEAFLNIARVALENERKLQRIEAALTALTSFLSLNENTK